MEFFIALLAQMLFKKTYKARPQLQESPGSLMFLIDSLAVFTENSMSQLSKKTCMVYISYIFPDFLKSNCPHFLGHTV